MVTTKKIAAEYRLSYWAGIMREREESGKSIKAYCDSVGLQQNVYHYWQRKLREAVHTAQQRDRMERTARPVSEANERACQELLPKSRTNLLPQNTAPDGWALCTAAGSDTNLRLISLKKRLVILSGY